MCDQPVQMSLQDSPVVLPYHQSRHCRPALVIAARWANDFSACNVTWNRKPPKANCRIWNRSDHARRSSSTTVALEVACERLRKSNLVILSSEEFSPRIW